MLTATIHDLAMFENFLNIINRFVQQCEFELHTDKVNVFCSNTRDYPSSRLLLDSDTISLDKNQNYNCVKIYIRDVMAFKSAISIIRDINEDLNSIQISLDDVKNEMMFDDSEKVLIKSIKYNSKKGGKFNLITVDKSVIVNYVSKELSRTLEKNLIFNINPKMLDILQNRTGNIVDSDEISVYIYPNKDKNEHNIILDLTSKKSSSTNQIALPISDDYSGSLDGFSYGEIVIHDSAFRILNILKATDSNDLNCFFNIENNVLFVESEIRSKNGYKIHSRLLAQMITGK